MANIKVKNNNNQDVEDEFSKMWKSITSTIVGIFTLIILTVFPIFYKDYYFDILQAKYRFYYLSVIGMSVIMLITAIIFACIDFSGYNGAHIRNFLKKLNVRSLTLPDWALIAFLVSAIIATIQSEYPYEAFWGNEGRYTGLFLLMLYGISFFLISKFLKFRQWYLDAFLASAMIVCGLGIANYFNMDPLRFKVDMDPKQMEIFTSTLGNVNTYTAYVALVVGISTVLFSLEKNILRQLWYFLTMCVGLFALITGISDNAYLALGALIGLLPLFLFSSFKKLKRYFVIVAILFTEFQVISMVRQKRPVQEAEINGVLNIIAQFDKLLYVVLLCWGICALLYVIDYMRFGKEDKKLGPWLQLAWGVCILICLSGIGFMLYDANIGGNAEKYGGLKDYLVLNDDWGSHRGYIWRIGMENYMEFSPMKKLFGYGPDTFGIITVNNNYDEMTELYGEIFDSAHNEYLQYLITIGIAGLASYLVFLVSSCLRMAKNIVKTPAVAATLFAVVCYAAQALVNINLPIATPVMWTLVMVGLAGCNKKS